MKRRAFLKGLGATLLAAPVVGAVVGKVRNVLPVANGGTGATPFDAERAARMAKYKGEILRHAVPIEVLHETSKQRAGFVPIANYGSRVPVHETEIGSVDVFGPPSAADPGRITFRRPCPFA